MKNYFFAFALMLAFVLPSCDKYDDSELREMYNNLENRVQTLEGMCREMNTNIESLETVLKSLKENEHVSNIAPIVEDGEVVGYTITFTSGESVTIYNRENSDAAAPKLGVAKDQDGVYYWTLDGEWLLDDAGQKVKAEGEDGQTPRLKVENGYWYVSYDNGETWTEAGRATTEGSASGDSLFKEVSYDDEYVYLTLADGTVLILPRVVDETPQPGVGGNAVDLGLSVKWADCNIGAESAEEYGDYFAWGETEPKTDYNEWNSVTFGKATGEISGNATYDAATALWGEGWRLPTKEEAQELVDNCTWTWEEQNGVGGMKVVGSNGNSIFLPAAGYYKETTIKNLGSYGSYATGSLQDSYNYQTPTLNFDTSIGAMYWDYRYNGSVIRPVME